MSACPCNIRTAVQDEWRSLGVQQGVSWEHYLLWEAESHILLFRRALLSRTENAGDSVQLMFALLGRALHWWFAGLTISWIRLGLAWAGLWLDLGPILGRLQADLGPTLGQPWANFGPTLGRPWAQALADLGSTFGRLLIDF